MKTLLVVALLSSVLFSSIGHTNNIDPDFAIDPASPSIDGNITPDDVLRTGPTVFQQGTGLGLQDDFFSGVFDNLNALSYGQDPVTRPPPGKDLPIYFSVDRVAVGLSNTDVNTEAQPGNEEASGDVFVTQFPGGAGTNHQFIDEEELGLIPGFFGDDLDALELDTKPSPYFYFSVDGLSVSLDWTDLWASTGAGDVVQYADGESQIGLLSDDDIDALILFDLNLDNIATPGVDLALFSLSTFSPSTFTFTGNAYAPGVQGSLSPSDILFTDFTGNFSLWAAADDVGLRADDELNALDTIPEPGTFVLVAVGLVFLVRRGKMVKRQMDTAVLRTLPLLLILALSPVVNGADDTDRHFAGFSPPVAGSGAMLTFKPDIVNDQTFSWASSDFILGEINTNFISASKWLVFGANPTRVVFEGGGDAATFKGNVIFEPYNRAVVDVVKGGRRVRYLLKLSTCTIRVFRDLPRWTDPLTDWPEVDGCPRSPRYTFGENRVISVEVARDDTSLNSILVEVENKSTNAIVEITADLMGDVYRNRVTDEDLFLSDVTMETGNGDFIHTREEDVLVFRVKDQPTCLTNWIVDRGEGAATSPRDDDQPATGIWDWLFGNRHKGIPNLMAGSAEVFMEGVTSFGPPTTNWWDVGRDLISDDMGPFIMDAGANNPKDREADVLYIAAHSNSRGRLWSYDGRIGAVGDWFLHFDPLVDLDSGQDWNEDLDWAILDSCQTLSNVPRGTPPIRAYQKWVRALNGSPRRAHGLLGFHGKAPGNTNSIIQGWSDATSRGTKIVAAWIRAARSEPWAVLYISRNAPDSVHSMQRDPCPDDGFIYRAFGGAQSQRKKIGPDGKFIPTRAAEGPESPDAADIPYVDEMFGGQCRSTVDLSSGSEGEAPRLLIERNEILTHTSDFTLNADGIYEKVLDLGVDDTNPNTLDNDTVKSLVQAELENGFSNVPSSLQITQVLEDEVVELDSVGNIVSIRNSSYEVLLDQLFTLSSGATLPIFNSGGRARLMPDGTIEYVEMAYYEVVTTGSVNSLLTLRDSAESAAQQFLIDYPEWPCLLTDSFLYYGSATPVGGKLEVRPVQITEFLEGKVVVYVDAISGDVLEIDSKL